MSRTQQFSVNINQSQLIIAEYWLSSQKYHLGDQIQIPHVSKVWRFLSKVHKWPTGMHHSALSLLFGVGMCFARHVRCQQLFSDLKWSRKFCTMSWWCHEMEARSALLALRDGETTCDRWILIAKDQQCSDLVFSLLLSCWTNGRILDDLRGQNAYVKSL